MWDPHQKTADPAHGMPGDVIEELRQRKILKANGPHAYKTVSRPLSNWSILRQWKGVDALFDHPGIRRSVVWR
ncbi:hypothetical protein [Microvirga sp. Mcv34]|uniref:hypothetical protein n=1 Tax=Microvirga sp. Mcv34 TaxID=2926016 RepID=UPI0021CA1BFD|nr:hypothetical protein [Microvirga sp. Mcv34]